MPAWNHPCQKCAGIDQMMFQIGFSLTADLHFFASLLDVSTKILPPRLLLGLCASACFGFVTVTAQRLPQNALPAAEVVVLERYHSRYSLLRAVGAVVAQSSDLASCIHVDTIAATIL